MDLEIFIKNFAEQFDDVPLDQFNADTPFRENEEWSSMTALSIIAMVDDTYAVRLTGDDIRKSITVKDIFDVVFLKANA
jgi:acyl carrier protein